MDANETERRHQISSLIRVNSRWFAVKDGLVFRFGICVHLCLPCVAKAK